LTAAIQPGTDSLTARRSEIRILIADGERAIADTLQMILSRHGFEVVIAYEGKTALEKARQFSPRVFLCDVMMPDMNGVEVAIQVRAILPSAG
jgi:DNA-binding response OmpR family regulator